MQLENLTREFLAHAKARGNFKAKTFFLNETEWERDDLPPFAVYLKRHNVARGYKAAHEAAFKKYPYAQGIIFLRTKYFLEKF